MSRRKNYNPVIPRNYKECSAYGKRAIDRHRDPTIGFKLNQIRDDGRLCVLWTIAEHKTVNPQTFVRLTKERREAYA